MSDPACPQKAPYGIDLKAGDHWWCACGQSKNQPFCDGSHKGTEFTPVKFTVAADGKKWLCGCKRTAGQPFCDGSHKKL